MGSIYVKTFDHALSGCLACWYYCLPCHPLMRDLAQLHLGAVNISPDHTHTPPLAPRTRHCSKILGITVRPKGPGRSVLVSGAFFVRSRIEVQLIVQLSNVSWIHKRRESVNVRLAANLKNWHFTEQEVQKLRLVKETHTPFIFKTVHFESIFMNT